VANQTSCLVQADGTLIVREIDGSPSLADISILEVPNGTLSQPAPGIARITISASAEDGGYFVTLGHGGGVPPAVGVRFLKVLESTNTGDVGFCLTSAATLVGLTLAVDNAHPTNTYRLEMLSDPTGKQGSGPTVIGFLDLAATVRKDSRRDLSVLVALGAELGARLRRTGGSGPSTPLKQIVMGCEFVL
jgi:hypothetical protein